MALQYVGLPPLETLYYLNPPFEILELQHCESITIRVLRWQLGKIDIRPRYAYAPPIKTIHALRLFTEEKYKKYPPYYYDITSKRLIAALMPFLQRPDYDLYEVTIHAVGSAPRKYFEIEIKRIE